MAYDYSSDIVASNQEWGTDPWFREQSRAYIESRGGLGAVRYGAERKKLASYLKFLRSAGPYASLQRSTRGELTGAFREYAETGAARALGGVLRQQRLSSQRAGLGRGGLAGRGIATARADVLGQSLQAQQQFSTQLMTLQAQNRDLFVRGQFDFMNSMDMAFQKQQFTKDLLYMQARLQQDAEARQAYYSLAGGIGSALGLIF